MNQKDVNSLLVKHDANAEIIKLYAERARLENDLSKWQEILIEVLLPSGKVVKTDTVTAGLADRLERELAIANKRIAELEAENMWHPASEPPDDVRDVLTLGRYGIKIACHEYGLEDDSCWFGSSCLMADFKCSVTHWRELPKLRPTNGEG